MAGSGIAAGAAAGSAFGPWGTAIGGALGAVSDMMGGGSAAAPKNAGPAASAYAVYGSSNLHGDNWSVNFSGTQNNTPRVDKTFSATGPTASTASEGGAVMPQPLRSAEGIAAPAGVPTWAMVALGGLVLWKLAK